MPECYESFFIRKKKRETALCPHPDVMIAVDVNASHLSRWNAVGIGRIIAVVLNFMGLRIEDGKAGVDMGDVDVAHPVGHRVPQFIVGPVLYS